MSTDSAYELLKEFGITDEQINEARQKREAHLAAASKEDMVRLYQLSVKHPITESELEEMVNLRIKAMGS